MISFLDLVIGFTLDQDQTSNLLPYGGHRPINGNTMNSYKFSDGGQREG